MANTMLIVFMSLSIVLLFSIMVMTAMASSAANASPTECQEKCHSYSMYSAVTTGVTVILLIGVLIYYIYSTREELASSGAEHALALHKWFKDNSGEQTA